MKYKLSILLVCFIAFLIFITINDNITMDISTGIMTPKEKAYGHPSLIPLEKRKHWPNENGMLLIPKKELIPDSELFLIEKDSSEYAFNGRLHYVLKDSVYSFNAPCHYVKDSFYVEDFIYNISKRKVTYSSANEIEYGGDNGINVIKIKYFELNHIYPYSYDNIHQGLFGPFGEEYHSREHIEPYPENGEIATFPFHSPE